MLLITRILYFLKIESLRGKSSHRKQMIARLRTQQVDMGHVGKTKREKIKNWVRVPICCDWQV